MSSGLGGEASPHTTPSPALRGSQAGQATAAEYAEWLGLQPEVHKELMWIAEEAALAAQQAPDGWELRADPQGRAYYYREASGDSLREHPRDAEFRQLVAQLKLEHLHASKASQTTHGAWSAMATPRPRPHARPQR